MDGSKGNAKPKKLDIGLDATFYKYKSVTELLHSVIDSNTKNNSILINYAIPMIAMYGFTIELGFKAIYRKFLNNSHAPNTHDLKELYDVVSKIPYAQNIKSEVCSFTGASHEKFLFLMNKHKDIFVNWRYLQVKDGDELSVDFVFLRSLVNSIQNTLKLKV